jgi:serine/threonine protein kinase
MDQLRAEVDSTAGSATIRSAPQRQFGKYQIIEELGSGGMAVVYLAVARGPSAFKKLVVLKLLRESETSSESDTESATERTAWVDMFLNEGRLAARLNHPNVVQTLEAGEAQGRHLIVMEYLDGRTLKNIQDREKELGKRLPLSGWIRIVADALAGLHHAHELTDFDGSPLGVVHRDVSPHNIFVTFDGRVKVLDFGIAKLSTPSQTTATGVLKGKVRYMSPEQLTGEQIDRRTDVFAAGVLLWEVLTGASLWADKGDVQILQFLLNAEPLPHVLDVNPLIPERLGQVCMVALDYDPSRRFASCAEFRAELLACLDEFPEQATNEAIGLFVSEMFSALREKHRQAIAKRLATLEAAPESPESELPGPVSHMRPRRSSSRIWLSLALLLALGLGSAYAWRNEARSVRVDSVRSMNAVSTTLPVAPRVPAPSVTEPITPPTNTTLELSPSEAPHIALHSKTNRYSRPGRASRDSTSRDSASSTPANGAAAPPAEPEAVTPNVGVDGSHLRLDTDNPWSAGAAPQKP